MAGEQPKFNFGQQAGQNKPLFGASTTQGDNNANPFGATSGGSGTNTGGSLFGNLGGNNNQKSSVFGSTPASTGNASSIFSQQSSSEQKKPLFGGASVTGGGFSFGPKPASPAPGSSAPALQSTAAPSLFSNMGQSASPAATPGEQPKSTAGGGLFGSTPATTTGGTGAGSLFGGGSQPSWGFGAANNTPASGNQQQPASTQSVFSQNNTQSSNAPSQGLFGSSTTTPQANKTFQPSTTPAGQPPTSGLFGNLSKQNENQQAAPTQSQQQQGGGGLFGKSPAPTSTSAPAFQFPGTAAPQASGSQQPNNASLFAPKTTAQGQSGTPAPSQPSGGSNIFGAAASQPPAAPASSGTSAPSLFSGLGQNQGAAPSSSASQQPASTGTAAPSLFSGFNLGGGNATSSGTSQPAATTTSAPSFGGGGAFSLGGQTGSSGTSQPATTAPTAPSGGSGLFGATTSGQAGSSAPGAQSNTTSAPTAGNLFGGAAAGQTGTSGQGAQSSTTSAPGAGNLFGGATTGQTGTSAQGTQSTGNGLFGATTGQTGNSAQGAQSTGSGLFGATGSNTTAGAQPAASTSGPAPPQQSRLASKSMDEILTMWSTSLATHQKTFQQLATRVSAWDRMLVENSSKISTLYGRCFQAERDCSEVERQLSNVEHEQLELEALLDRYEGDVDRIMDQAGMGDGGAGVSGVDAERERTYKTAEACSTRLTEMNHSLTDMIEEINAASGKLTSTNQAQTRPDDPLAEIVRVLNQHLSQLQTIDTGAAALQAKVVTAQRDARNLSQQQGLNGGRDEWIDGFGRSYLGRR